MIYCFKLGEFMRKKGFIYLTALIGLTLCKCILAQNIGDQVDVSLDFQKLESTYFVGNRISEFNVTTGAGSLEWRRFVRQPSLSFNKIDLGFNPSKSNEFPASAFDENPILPIEVSFVSPRTVRIRFSTRAVPFDNQTSPMLVGEVPKDNTWKVIQNDSVVVYKSEYGILKIIKSPWHIEFYDSKGKLLTRTNNINDSKSFTPHIPFSFIRRSSDLGRTTAASFQLSYDEKIYGCGESFTRLNKRGQKVILYTRDANGVQNTRMYKPIPFFLSSNGYGMFVHTSTPVTFDFGLSYDQSNIIFTGDEILDLFVFVGEPKEILSEYTAITGRSPVPPLWSFGLWMSRITYKAEDEVREVANKLRDHKIPSDVLHLDTGWFETDWQCDYKFSKSRFNDEAKMISDLDKQGFKISLWQMTYFSSKNPIYKTLVDSGFVVKNEGGALPYEDAVIDFSNPKAVKYYQSLLGNLLKLGVGAIKADFGEDAPLHGIYASGRTGFYEHNLYPLRYNKAVSEITNDITGENIIWGRSAWAGSQRYPLHWGGDAENTNSAMAATLRGGLSFGLSGFTYWSHDVGGFVETAPRDLYKRWLAFGVLTSHTRCHGQPPREPWTYDVEFENDFRRAVELKYSLMPYIYAQSKKASENGWPMLRTLFFEYPNDPTAWLIEDEYMFGENLLVAPLFEENAERRVYLPEGKWIDYQTKKSYQGARWHKIESGKIPIILLVKDHSVIPHIAVAQSTSLMDWNNIELRVFSSDKSSVEGLFALPNKELREIKLVSTSHGYEIKNDPYKQKIKWTLN